MPKRCSSTTSKKKKQLRVEKEHSLAIFLCILCVVFFPYGLMVRYSFHSPLFHFYLPIYYYLCCSFLVFVTREWRVACAGHYFPFIKLYSLIFCFCSLHSLSFVPTFTSLHMQRDKKKINGEVLREMRAQN